MSLHFKTLSRFVIAFLNVHIPKSSWWNLTPNVMVSDGEPLWGGWWGWSPQHGISILVKEAPESSSPSLQVRTQREDTVYEPGSRSLADTESTGPLIWEVNICCWYAIRSWWLVIAAWRGKDKTETCFLPKEAEFWPGALCLSPPGPGEAVSMEMGCTSVEGGMFRAGQVRQNPYDCLNTTAALQPSRCKGGRRGIHSGGLVGPSGLETQQWCG